MERSMIGQRSILAPSGEAAAVRNSLEEQLSFINAPSILAIDTKGPFSIVWVFGGSSTTS